MSGATRRRGTFDVGLVKRIAHKGKRVILYHSFSQGAFPILRGNVGIEFFELNACQHTSHLFRTQNTLDLSS